MIKCANKTKQKHYGQLRPLRNMSYKQVRQNKWIKKSIILCLTQVSFVRSIKGTGSINWCYVSGKIWPIPRAGVYCSQPFEYVYKLHVLRTILGIIRGGWLVFNPLVRILPKTNFLSLQKARCAIFRIKTPCVLGGTSYYNSDSLFEECIFYW